MRAYLVAAYRPNLFGAATCKPAKPGLLQGVNCTRWRELFPVKPAADSTTDVVGQTSPMTKPMSPTGAIGCPQDLARLG
jgi:hypothetical protein